MRLKILSCSLLSFSCVDVFFHLLLNVLGFLLFLLFAVVFGGFAMVLFKRWLLRLRAQRPQLRLSWLAFLVPPMPLPSRLFSLLTLLKCAKQLSLIVQIDAHTLRSSYRHLLLASRRPRLQPCWIRSEWLLRRRHRSTTQLLARPRRLLELRPLRPRFRSHRKRQRLECPRLLRQPFRWLYQRRREFLCKKENFRVSMESWITLGRAVIDGLPGELFFRACENFK